MTNISDYHWQAIVNRDTSLAGEFVIGVSTTGIFCRPGCPARTPHRANVEFYPTIRDALLAGYRPCKRCRPLETTSESALARAVARAIEAMGNGNGRLDTIASEAGLTPEHFARVFADVTGLTLREVKRAHRAAALPRSLRSSTTTSHGLLDAGYAQSGKGYVTATDDLGMAPSTFRKGCLGERIRWTIVETWLGQTLIAATERGICRLMFGDNRDELAQILVQNFPNAELLPAEDGFQQLVEQTIDVLEQPSRAHLLPLDLRGTVFQMRVWTALRSIPAGNTVSYSALADTLGQPNATRAVASAVAKNNVAVLVPCHRVVGKDGSLTGYRWGTERKGALLERERPTS